MRFVGPLVAALLFASATANGAAADLAVVGTGDGLEVLRAVGAAYTADHPETGVWVPPSVHSSGGINAVRAGTAVLGRIARPLSLEERAEGSRSASVSSAVCLHNQFGGKCTRPYR
jgi:phosphate transport system substrate-binding protein